MTIQSAAGVGRGDEGAGTDGRRPVRRRGRRHRIVLPAQYVVHGDARPCREGAGLGEEGERSALDGEGQPGPEEVAEAEVVGAEGRGRNGKVLLDASLGPVNGSRTGGGG